jgi:hypothetical protein
MRAADERRADERADRAAVPRRVRDGRIAPSNAAAARCRPARRADAVERERAGSTSEPAEEPTRMASFSAASRPLTSIDGIGLGEAADLRVGQRRVEGWPPTSWRSGSSFDVPLRSPSPTPPTTRRGGRSKVPRKGTPAMQLARSEARFHGAAPAAPAPRRCAAISDLFAVTTGVPRSSARRTKGVRRVDAAERLDEQVHRFREEPRRRRRWRCRQTVRVIDCLSIARARKTRSAKPRARERDGAVAREAGEGRADVAEAEQADAAGRPTAIGAAVQRGGDGRGRDRNGRNHDDTLQRGAARPDGTMHTACTRHPARRGTIPR